MVQMQMIQQVVEWERRLEIEDEQRKNYRSEPDYYTAAPQPSPTKRGSIFARIFHPREMRQPAYPCCAQEQCHETV